MEAIELIDACIAVARKIQSVAVEAESDLLKARQAEKDGNESVSHEILTSVLDRLKGLTP